MSKSQEELGKALKGWLAGPVQTFTADVVSVDQSSLTCVVQPADGPELSDVRLKAAIDNVKEGAVEFPTVGSSVLVGIIGNDENTAFLLKCSNVDKVMFYDGLKGGLINIQTLIMELNKTNAVVNAIKTSLTSWTPVSGDGGAALKALASSQLSGKSTGDFTTMEDARVVH